MAWCKLADKITRFFHLQCLNRWRKNTILKISNGDMSFHDATLIKRIIVDYFKDRFCKQRSFSDILPNMPLQSLPSKFAESLELPFSLEEIKSVVWQYDSSKAPGPDSANFYFYKWAQPLIKEDLSRLFYEFFTSASLSSPTHASFIALILKVMGASRANDFRPISMVFIKQFLTCWLLGLRKYSL